MARIKFGISNVKYAPVTAEAQDGTLTYGEVQDLRGAVALTLDTAGEEITEYADNIVWYAQSVNQGYTGTLELEELPDAFRTAILGDEMDNSDVLWESADAEPTQFALMFQFQVGGDSSVSGKRGCLLRCTASRPSANMNTKEATITPNHDTLNIVAMPRTNDHLVKATCESTSAKYDTWFNAVPVKA